jgi:hypothetical protein
MKLSEKLLSDKEIQDGTINDTDDFSFHSFLQYLQETDDDSINSSSTN